MRNVLTGSAFGVGALLASSFAFAQPTEPTDSGGFEASGSVDLSTEAQPLPPPPPPEPAPAPAPAPEPVVTTAAAADEGTGPTDHEKVIGKFGVMYFGVSQQPIGTGAPNGVGRGNVSMPVIGARYWLDEMIGIDLGLGFNFLSSSTTVESNGQEVSVDGPAVVALGIHAGVPLAFAYGKHYKFLLVPELNFGYATQTEAAQNVPNPPPDIHRSGVRLDIGARVGSEIQFGFIGIPQLALQASVGLNFRHQRWGSSQDAGPGVAASSSSQSANSFGTTVQSDPWALFTNNISAIYYFP